MPASSRSHANLRGNAKRTGGIEESGSRQHLEAKMNRKLALSVRGARQEPHPTPSREDLLLLYPGMAWALGIGPAPTGVKPVPADAASELVLDPAKLA